VNFGFSTAADYLRSDVLHSGFKIDQLDCKSSGGKPQSYCTPDTIGCAGNNRNAAHR
jgi:hypothetical protein